MSARLSNQSKFWDKQVLIHDNFSINNIDKFDQRILAKH